MNQWANVSSKQRIIILSISIVFLLMGCTKGAITSNEDTLQQGTSGIVSVESAELHYVIEGKGTPCLVLGHLESERRILSQELRNHFRFVFMDLRHDARSGSSLEISKITLDTYLDDIDKVRRNLSLDVAAVFGHSIHSYIALEYARKYPKNTSHVIITGTTPYRSPAEVADEFWESDASDERKMILGQNWEKISEEELSRMSPKEAVSMPGFPPARPSVSRPQREESRLPPDLGAKPVLGILRQAASRDRFLLFFDRPSGFCLYLTSHLNGSATGVPSAPSDPLPRLSRPSSVVPIPLAARCGRRDRRRHGRRAVRF